MPLEFEYAVVNFEELTRALLLLLMDALMWNNLTNISSTILSYIVAAFSGFIRNQRFIISGDSSLLLFRQTLVSYDVDK